jgi:hypothetical protein
MEWAFCTTVAIVFLSFIMGNRLPTLIVVEGEALEKFGDIYPGMSPNDWRHIIESYTKNQGNNESSDFQIADEYPMEMGLKVAEDIE